CRSFGVGFGLSFFSPYPLLCCPAVHHPWCRLRLPLGRFNAELLGVLRVQPLPAAKLHGLRANDASNGLIGEKPIQHIQTNVPSSSTHGNEAAINVGPKRQARAAGKRFEFPSHIKVTPSVLKHIGSVSPLHGCFGDMRRGRSYRGEFHCSSNLTQVPIGIEGSPLAQVRRIGQRLPDFLRRVPQLSDENKGPLFSILSYLRPAGGTG